MTENNLLEKYFEEDFEKYEKYVERLSDRAEEKRFKFLGTDFSKLKELPKALYIKCLIIFYRELMFFPDEEIISKFKQLGMTEEQLKWFIPLSEINDAFIQINFYTPVTILNYFSIKLIQMYFEQKISDEIFRWANYTGKLKQKEKQIGQILLHNLFRKRYYFKKNFKKIKPKFPEENLHELIDYLNKITNKEEKTRRLVIDVTTGKTEKYFLHLMIQPVLDFKKICNKKLSDQDCLNHVFDLCKLIMKDETFMSQEEIEDSEDFIYGGKYERYKYAILRKLLNLSNPKAFKNWSF